MRSQVEDIELIELIYAALLGESSWQAFLDRLSDAGSGCWSVMHSSSKSGAEATVGLVSGRSPDDIADYPTYYHQISPWAPHCNARPAGKATIVENYVPSDVLERSEFYNDWLLRVETRSAIGIGVDSDDGSSLIFSLMTPNAQEAQMLLLANQMERIAPHLQRANEFYRRTSFAARSTELGGTFFDSLSMGMVIVGAGRKIRTCSDTASRMFGPDVGLDPLGRLTLGDQVARRLLETMLQRNYAGPRHQRVKVGSTLVTLIRMEGERERSFFEGPGVCLTMEALGSSRFLDTEQFARSYQLTPGEIRVLEGLICGNTVNQIAELAGRSRETIRSQLKSLCSKTGARGQADVLRMVAGMKA
ncbi:helix-turn-helix transcriptional regulator [Paracoccus laeviglucosivorans]|uniref:DNA-binding transcriptional regulator, CsgD family n=1 Tax=Paracoccus laeviglucosivorans TaxID=1197861 RepID=A0A521EK34_9RHOB|nr:helix-turn-helix transcriptional regulator [Paracoccus laeviglucosivorans]SMO84277.1 DNA-binding transcriptional regulator, CsgD family [Paracoccus laeviglucosivorans]